MLLPCAVLDSLLFLRALRTFVATLSSILLSVVLILPLLLGMLLLVLVLPLLLLGMLLLLVMVLPLQLLGMLLLLVLVLPLLFLDMLLLFGLGLLVLALLLCGMVLLVALLLVLCVSRGCDSEKQRQSRCADDSNDFHNGYLSYYCCYARLLWRNLPVRNSNLAIRVCIVYRSSTGFLMVKTAQ